MYIGRTGFIRTLVIGTLWSSAITYAAGPVIPAQLQQRVYVLEQKLANESEARIAADDAEAAARAAADADLQSQIDSLAQRARVGQNTPPSSGFPRFDELDPKAGLLTGIDDGSIPPHLKAPLNEFRKESEGVFIQWNPSTNTPRMIFNFKAGPYTGTPEERGRAFLKEWGRLFGLRPGLDNLRLNRRSVIGPSEAPTPTVEDRESKPPLQYLYFDQMYDNLPVEGGQIILHMTPDGEAVAVHNRYYPDITLENDFTIERSTALDIAIAALEKERKYSSYQHVKRIVFPVDGKFYGSWDVQYQGWQIIIDADSKQVLRKRKLVVHATGIAFVYPFDPVRTPTREPKLLTELYSSNYHLNGFWFEVRYPSYTPDVIIGSPSPAFGVDVIDFVTSTANGQAQVNLYYQLEEARKYFFSLGFRGREFDYTYGDGDRLKIVADAVVTESNTADLRCDAVYVKNQRLIRFGTSNESGNPPNCSYDMALRGDVVFHEYAHFLIDTLAELDRDYIPGSMDEGTADYFAASAFDDPCFAPTNNKVCKRNAANNKKWPDDRVNSWQGTGEIWSGALWDIRKAVGAEYADKIIYTALYGLPSNAEFPDYALQILIASNQRLTGKVDLWDVLNTTIFHEWQRSIFDAFCAHGIKPRFLSEYLPCGP